jgi:hypothetical protein
MSFLGRLFRRRSNETDSFDSQPADFDTVLKQAVRQGGDPRLAQVHDLAARGRDLGAISKDTRLARDAVRSVLGAA